MIEEKIIKIFCADRNRFFRGVISNALKEHSFEITGSSGNLNEIMQSLSTNIPDVLMICHRLDTEDASEFLPIVKEKFPDLKILMLTMYCTKESLLKYIKYLDGMICKSLTIEQAITVIKIIANGSKYFYIQ